MEKGQRVKVSSDRLVKPGIEPATPGLQSKRFIHYIAAAPTGNDLCLYCNILYARTALYAACSDPEILFLVDEGR